MNKITSMLLAATLSAGLTFCTTGTQFLQSDATSDNIQYQTVQRLQVVRTLSWTSNTFNYTAVVYADGSIYIECYNPNKTLVTNKEITFGKLEYEFITSTGTATIPNCYNYFTMLFDSTEYKAPQNTNNPATAMVQYQVTNPNHSYVSLSYTLQPNKSGIFEFTPGYVFSVCIKPTTTLPNSIFIKAFEQTIKIDVDSLNQANPYDEILPYDVNTDGVVNTLDLLCLKRRLLGYDAEENTTVMTELAITETEAVTEIQATISETTCSEELLSTAEIVTETVVSNVITAVSEIETAEVLNSTTYNTANE